MLQKSFFLTNVGFLIKVYKNQRNPEEVDEHFTTRRIPYTNPLSYKSTLYIATFQVIQTGSLSTFTLFLFSVSCDS